MPNSVPLYCPNPTCQAANAEDQHFCQKCSTVLPHHYLWAIGSEGVSYQPGDWVADRYFCKQPNIFLDTKPGLLSNTYRELPQRYLPYLRLVSYRLHLPQVYDWVQLEPDRVDLLLLERVPLARADQPTAATVTPLSWSQPAASIQLLPRLTDQWQQASPLRQLNWMWQIANLWQPLSSEQAAGSLLDPELLRVEGSLLRLARLRLLEEPQLADLGQQWLQWAAAAHPEVSGFLTHLGQGLISGQIPNAEVLVSYLDSGLAQLSQAQTRQIELITLTDQGPTRQRNEDACYPASGTRSTHSNRALLIVCDGIGGHQGGDVASQLAITTLEQRVKALDLDRLDPISLSIELEKAVCEANNQISQRNDQENRFERQRMGTTVVMALVRDHELYITHVGDSRAYWITARGCHQLTLDDDVASREVRLGYSFYRQALHQPSAGSLVQALGMGDSTLLYPSVQRLIPEAEGVLLLCSDGLSDNDRVEESWEAEILPLLSCQTDLATVSQRLVEIGNTRNGYDNVTVGVIHYRIAITHPLPVLSELPDRLPTVLPPKAAATTVITRPTDLETADTTLVAPIQSGASAALSESASSARPQAGASLPSLKLSPLLWGAGLLMVIAAGVGAILPLLRNDRPVADPAAPLDSPASPAGSAQPLTALEVEMVVQLSQAQPDGALPMLLDRPRVSPTAASPQPTAEPEPQSLGTIPIGTVLEVVSQQSLSQQESWVKLRVCRPAPISAAPSIGTTVSPAGTVNPEPNPAASNLPAVTETPPSDPAQPAQIGQSPASLAVPTEQMGWIQEREILPLLSTPSDPAAAQLDCQRLSIR